MSRSKSPRCMFCKHDPPKPIQKGRRFCSMNCASSYADNIVNESDSGWCSVCESWYCTEPEHDLIRPEEENKL